MLHYVDEPSQESKVLQVEPEKSGEHVEHAAEEPLENEAHEWKPLRLNRNRPVPATEPAAPVSERVSVPVEIPVAEEPAAQAVQSTARTTPIPPYELSKERRREAALQAATRAEAAPVVVEPTIDPRPAPPGVELALSHDETAPAVEETLLEVRREAGSGQEASAVANAAKRAKDTVQEQMRFESPNRGGRFEKTDPTIVNGEDLDVPTFMRQRLPLE
jgi:cell division protein FtsZ